MKTKDYKPVRMPSIFYCPFEGCTFQSSIYRQQVFHQEQEHGIIGDLILKVNKEAFKEWNKLTYLNGANFSARDPRPYLTKVSPKRLEDEQNLIIKSSNQKQINPKYVSQERLLHLQKAREIKALKRLQASEQQIQQVKDEYRNMKETIKQTPQQPKKQESKKHNTLEQKVLKTTDLLLSANSGHNGYDVMLLTSLVIWPLVIILLPFYGMARLIVWLFKWLFKKG